MRKPMTTQSTGSEKLFFTTNEAFKAGWRSEFVTKNGPTVMRLYPHFINGVAQDQLLFGGTGEDMIGEWMAPYLMVTNFGPGKISGVVEMKDAVEGAAHPINVLIDKLQELKNSDASLIKDEALLQLYRKVREWAFGKEAFGSRKPQLEEPKYSLFLRGTATMLRGEVPEDFATKQRMPQEKVLVRASEAAMEDFIEKLTTEEDTSKPLSVENSLMGDVLGPNGHCIKIHSVSRTLDTGMNITPYVIEKDVAMPLDHDKVFKEIYEGGKFCDWDRLIYRPTIAQMMQKLALAVGADSVEYALGNHPLYRQYLPGHTVNVQSVPSSTPTTPVETSGMVQSDSSVQPEPPPAYKSHVMYETLKAAGMPEEAIEQAIKAMGTDAYSPEPGVVEEDPADQIPDLDEAAPPPPAPEPQATGKEPSLAELAAQMSAAQAQFEEAQDEEK